MQARTTQGDTPWYELGRWASHESSFRRTSAGGQADEAARVDVDVLVAGERPFRAYRLRVEPVSGARLLALAAASAAPLRAGSRVPSEPLGRAVELDVPCLAQFPHRGHFPEYGGGGVSWCSPASLAMAIAFWGRGPTSAELAWTGASHLDAQVDHAARGTYDAAYGGCGNWSFGAAYAASFGLDAVVVWLASLRDVENLLAQGVPVIVSLAAAPGELPGFALPEGTEGHLVVVRGVTAGGEVVVNDPAAEGNEDVRRVYPRAPFERAWLAGSGGAAIVVRAAGARGESPRGSSVR
mgnify:CR=1 FL=1